MRQDGQPPRYRRKRCLCCKNLFDPDPRTKGKQKYCPRLDCQQERQRLNEKNWRERNPDCLEHQQRRSREWHRAHPGYSGERRAKDVKLARRNCEFTRERMRRLRAKIMFDKSKLILTQLIGNTATSCYLSRNAGWLFLRLPKARSLLKRGCWEHNRGQFKRIDHRQARLPAGRLHDLSKTFGKTGGKNYG